MYPVLERGDDPEVSPATAQAPEEVLVLIPTSLDKPTIGGDHVDREQVVRGEPELALQPAAASAQGEARNLGVGHAPTRNGEAELLPLPVELAPGETGLSTRRPSLGIHPHPLHGGEIHYNAPLTHIVSGDRVPATPYRQCQVVILSEAHRRHHIGLAGAAGDQGRSTVYHGVEQYPSGIISIVVRTHQLPAEASVSSCTAVSSRLSPGGMLIGVLS